MGDWRENKVVGIAAGALAVGMICLTVFLLVKPKQHTLTLIDVETGKVFEKAVEAGTPFPMASESGKRTVYIAQRYLCDRGHTFHRPIRVPDPNAPTDRPPAMEGQPLVCLICGSDKVSPSTAAQTRN